MGLSRLRTKGTPDIKTGRISEAMQRYSLGREKMKAVAREAGAIIKTGSGKNSATLYNFSVLDEYLDELSGEGFKSEEQV